jgi:Patatin-like phospholipase
MQMSNDDALMTEGRPGHFLSRGRRRLRGCFNWSRPRRSDRTDGGFAGQAAMIVLTAGALSACSNYHFTPGAPSVYQSNAVASDPDTSRPLVGVAISGGGNRSALFASYVLELLGSLPVTVATNNTEGTSQPDSFLDTIDHISSVSGGSFAAAYFGMKGPGHYGVLVKDQPMPKTYADFFSAFHAQMNFNWEAALFGLKGFSFGSNAQRLAKAIDSQFLNGATFETLDQREASGASPFLIFNATHYDSGRRFVMTTIPSSEFCLNTEQFLQDIVYTPTSGQAEIDAKHLAKLDQCDRRDPLTPEGFDSFWNPSMIRAVQTSDLPLARIVATSGSFPLLVGPVAYSIRGDQSLLHLIDGGVADNSGVESLTQLFLRDLIKNPKRKGLIVELDAGLPFNARGTKIAEDMSPLSAFLHDPTRPSDIQEVRASMYRQDLWAITVFIAKNMKSANNAATRLSIEQLQPDDLKVGSLRIQVGECHLQFNDAESVHAAARDIPTNYHLDTCAAQLVRIAACWSVHKHAPAIQQFFEQTPTTDRREVIGTGTLDGRIRAMCPELVSAGAL